MEEYLGLVIFGMVVAFWFGKLWGSSSSDAQWIQDLTDEGHGEYYLNEKHERCWQLKEYPDEENHH